MHIRHVTISVPNPAETAGFLADLFHIPAMPAVGGVSLSVGASTLMMKEGLAEPDGYYHLAFEIPENAIVEARDLLRASVSIFNAGDDGIITGAAGWDSHSVYFNAPGNLNLELIARHRSPSTIGRPFALRDILKISEVGISVEDPIASARELQERTGIAPFNEPGELFAPMGSDEGLLVLVKNGRIWYPTTDQTTTRRPLEIRIESLDGDFSLGDSCLVVGIPTDHA